MSSGDGHYKRNKETHRAQMANHGLEMYQRVSQTIRDAVGSLLKELPGLVEVGVTEIIAQITYEIEVFFEHNTAKDTRTSPKKYVSPIKVGLQDALETALDNLFKAWHEDINFEVEEAVDVANLEFEGGDRYNVDSWLHDDDYGFGSSDDDSLD